MMNENFMTVESVAKYFSVSKKTVRHWERIGKIKGTRFCGSLRFEPSAITEFLQREAAKREAVTT
jgi:excisionase family DNA binding protein